MKIFYWENGGAIKNDEKTIKNITKISPKKREKILAFFEEKNGLLFHAELDAELSKAVENKEKQRKRTEAARAAKEAKTNSVTDSVTTPVTDSPLPLPLPIGTNVPINTHTPNGVCVKSPTNDSGILDVETEPCPYRKLIEIWHEVLPEAASVKEITTKRKEHLKARWMKHLGRDRKQWRAYLLHIRESDWLMGRAPGANGRPFRLNIDFAINADNFVKIMENRYHDDSQTSTGGKSASERMLEEYRKTAGAV
jgi:hypothetical protein